VSCVAGGDWANVIDAVTRAKADYTPYVSIQVSLFPPVREDHMLTTKFGRNDQKASANISLAQYSTNIQERATEALAAGGIPIMVTPLSRRNFNSCRMH
jgi:hypothetical protein